MMSIQKGFTLIELLVVIAIIALISSIVLASLGTSRAKASDTAIKQGLVNLRSSAELYYSKNGNYGPAVSGCGSGGSMFSPTNADIWAILLQITRDNGPAVNSCFVSIGAGAAWAVSSPLRTDPTKHWCVDSNQASKQITNPITGPTCG